MNGTALAPVSARWGRPLLFGLTISIGLIAIAFGAVMLRATLREGALAIDYRLWLTIADRWIATGSMYDPGQIAGPFDPQPMGWTTMAALPSLYPPPAIFLFLACRFMPTLLWWAIPVAIIAWSVADRRPAVWTWPLMAACFLFPSTWVMFWVGSTTMWVVAFAALALRFGWPGVIILLKPSLAPFALIGIRRRSWWIALTVWCALAVMMLPAWLDYLAVVRNAGVGLGYSVANLPAIAVPIIAYLGRQENGPTTIE